MTVFADGEVRVTAVARQPCATKERACGKAGQGCAIFNGCVNSLVSQVRVTAVAITNLPLPSAQQPEPELS